MQAARPLPSPLEKRSASFGMSFSVIGCDSGLRGAWTATWGYYALDRKRSGQTVNGFLERIERIHARALEVSDRGQASSVYGRVT